MEDFRRQMPLSQFVRLSRIASLAMVGGETAILALMAYLDVPLKWIVVAAFFALGLGLTGSLREAVIRLDPERRPVSD
jgi:hypothetical protein